MDGNTSSMDKRNQTFLIQNLNDQKVQENIGGIVFISILMIVGTPGNAIVIYVYLRKYQPSTHRTFIVCLAMVDLAACCVSIPFFITILRYPIMFPNEEVCKIFHFLTYSVILGSALILVTIAAERYRKICIPHGKQLSEKMSRYVCILDMLVAGFFSLPGAVLYGNKRYTTGTDNITGIECTVSDDFTGTKYPTYFSFVLLFIFMASIIPISIMYTLIAKQLWNMNKRSSRKNQPQFFKTDTTRTQTTELSCLKFSDNEAATKSAEALSTNLENTSISILSSEGEGGKKIMDGDINQKYSTTKPDADKENNKNKERHKTIAFTRIFFIITVVLFCSFLPHWALRFADFLNKEFLTNLSFPGRVAYQTFRWSFFINSIANPIIYGFCDRKFMLEVRNIWKSFTELSFNMR